ncbi:polyisoprenoid-binding protein [Corynebacterium phocae]|uniref:Polyisoprenoid-binding protein n=1 Tax=Corynebacterium phocae TaxID=161895 RepID=A0A1L7D603_9CORY|nr:YceI family protein [Corynebacterium phocae]APT93550.1 polyisoprenoid-binding protein [Corynebacterium phocae]KAA8720639.1 YceI family protein [Corynebacterium phocae]
MFEGTYTLDPAHTTIGFVARHAMVTKVRGKFDEFEGIITKDSAQATIKAASINTGNDDRDAHVKGEDFFAVDKFPEITFQATAMDVNDEFEGTVTGDLTIKGTTKQITLKVEDAAVAEDPFGAQRLGFAASTKINRKDFGIDFNAPLKTGGMLVSEEIKIELEVSAIKQ